MPRLQRWKGWLDVHAVRDLVSRRLKIEHQGRTLLIDPWLMGSAYWRSWWNYPPVRTDRIAELQADFVYLSHIHWDHFHGPSLRALGANTQFLIPEDRYTRMRDDLVGMDFKHVHEIAHGRTFQLGPQFALVPYLFFPIRQEISHIPDTGDDLISLSNYCRPERQNSYSTQCRSGGCGDFWRSVCARRHDRACGLDTKFDFESKLGIRGCGPNADDGDGNRGQWRRFRGVDQ